MLITDKAVCITNEHIVNKLFCVVGKKFVSYEIGMEIMVIGLIACSWLSGVALALIGYDVAARLRYRADLADTLKKLNQTHNSLVEQQAGISDQISRLEMSIGMKAKPTNAR